MTRGIFITGTGTDVGKTYITGLILKKLSQANINVGYYKAVLSGADLINGEYIPGDASYVYQVSEINKNPNDYVSYIFKMPASPHLSSKIEGIEVEMDKISTDFERIKKEFEFITVEGSGGIICPISVGKENIMLTDIIKTFGLSIVIVGDSKLGSINSTILTVEYAKQKNISIEAIILNNFNCNNIIDCDNKKMIEKMSLLPVYTCGTNEKNLNISIDIIKKWYKK